VTSQLNLRPHRVPRADFDLLAGGYGDAGTIGLLKSSQRSKHLLQVRELLGAAPPGSARELRAGLDLLAEVQRKWPDLAADVLVHPHVGAWAAHSLRVLRSAETGSVPVETDLGHLAAVAATAAIRAGLDFAVNIPARNGIAHLPSLGSVAVRAGANTVPVLGIDGALFVDGRRLPDDLEAEETGWRPLRRLHATSGGLSISLELDDLDPYRNCHRLDAADRLDRAAVDLWQRRVDEAWPLLVRHHRRYAEAIAAGLVSLVPLSAGQTTRGVNATSMDAFGSMLVSPPVDGQGLAVALVHEFQHAKLGALLGLIDLHDDNSEPQYYAPWRDDPRPLGGLLHGAYAFMGVAGFWRVQRTTAAVGNVDFAHFEFARWRERVNRVLTVIVRSGHLTDAGIEFVAGMQATLDEWLAEPVPAPAPALAQDAADDHSTSWRIRNLQPDPAQVKQLVKAWRTGDKPPAGTMPMKVIPSESRALVENVRLDLVGLRISAPGRFAQLLDDPAALADAAPSASSGDLTYAREQYAAAVQEYRKLIVAEPTQRTHWAGLTLALRRLRPSPATTALLGHPEVVFAVYQDLVGAGETPEPDALADWLAGIVPGQPVS